MSQSFSSAEQIQKSYDFLNNVGKPACPNCSSGVKMCYHTPCIGTVDDMENLLDAGYAKNLMLDCWVGDSTKEEALNKAFPGAEKEPFTDKKFNPFDNDVFYLAPAIIGKEGQLAPFAKTGKCNLLIDNKCSLHDKGLKPIQGSLACCKIERVYINENGKQTDIDERISIMHTWNSQRGKDLIDRWKLEVNYQETGEYKVPMNLPELLESLEEVFKSHSRASKLDKELPKTVDDRPVKTLTYEKPY